jgi:hypothetical protein
MLKPRRNAGVARAPVPPNSGHGAISRIGPRAGGPVLIWLCSGLSRQAFALASRCVVANSSNLSASAPTFIRLVGNPSSAKKSLEFVANSRRPLLEGASSKNTATIACLTHQPTVSRPPVHASTSPCSRSHPDAEPTPRRSSRNSQSIAAPFDSKSFGSPRSERPCQPAKLVYESRFEPRTQEYPFGARHLITMPNGSVAWCLSASVKGRPVGTIGRGSMERQ